MSTLGAAEWSFNTNSSRGALRSAVNSQLREGVATGEARQRAAGGHWVPAGTCTYPSATSTLKNYRQQHAVK